MPAQPSSAALAAGALLNTDKAITDTVVLKRNRIFMGACLKRIKKIRIKDRALWAFFLAKISVIGLQSPLYLISPMS
jgi:hypothetical protein